MVRWHYYRMLLLILSYLIMYLFLVGFGCGTVCTTMFVFVNVFLVSCTLVLERAQQAVDHLFIFQP